MIAFILTVMTLMLTAMGIAREREMGTIEQLLVSPLRPVELVASKTVPYVLIGFLDVALILTVANPIRFFLAILRAILLKGSGPALLWADGLPLLILGILIFTGSLLRLRKRLG